MPTLPNLDLDPEDLFETNAKPLSLRSELLSATEEYAALAADFAADTRGHRDRLYSFTARCYAIGAECAKDERAFRRMMADPYWKKIRQKPQIDKCMKAVLTFTMRPTTEALRSRVIKTAAVLQDLHTKGVQASAIESCLKSGFGIERMYRALKPNSSLGHGMWDDVELARTDSKAVGKSPFNSEDAGELSFDSETAGECPFDDGPPAPPKAKTNGSSASAQPAQSGKGTVVRSLKSHFDPKSNLVVDLSEIDATLDELLLLKAFRIEVTVCDEEADTWRQVVATSVSSLP